MAIRIVQSKQNARLKELRAALLRPAKSLGEAGAAIAIEGLNLAAEALRSGLTLDTVFVAQGHESLVSQLGLSPETDILALPADLLASAVTTESPQPIAALLRPHAWEWTDLLPDDSPAPALLIVLAGIQDPGNLGTILRSAEAFAANGILTLPGTVSPWNPKAVRASAGSVFRLPLIAVSPVDCFQRLAAARVTTLAAMARDAQPLGQANLAASVALFIGSEGSGLAPEIAQQCAARITIPCPGPVESLNAAVAASLLLYEAARQRAGKPAKARRR
jgi:TrmH family RNA methyltransferase